MFISFPRYLILTVLCFGFFFVSIVGSSHRTLIRSRLRDRLVKIITDYRTETSLRHGCNDILKVLLLVQSTLDWEYKVTIN